MLFLADEYVPSQWDEPKKLYWRHAKAGAWSGCIPESGIRIVYIAPYHESPYDGRQVRFTDAGYDRLGDHTYPGTVEIGTIQNAEAYVEDRAHKAGLI